MKKRLLLWLLVFLFSLSLYSCKDMVFTPEGENFVEVEIPKTVMTIDLDKAADTLFIFGTADLKYSVNTNGKHFSRVVIYLDSTRVDASYDTSAFKGFDTEKYPSGAHKLRLELWARSGNGSLADRAGVEFLISTRSWNIFIDNRYSTSPYPMPTVDVVNGTIQISWEKYLYHNFYSYEVYRAPLVMDKQIPDDYTFKLMARFTDPSVTTLKDTIFSAGLCAYKVKLKAYKSNMQSSYSVFTDKPQISVTPLDDRRIKIVWHKPKCYANFKGYRLFMHPGNPTYDEYSTDFNRLSDTSYIDDRGFGLPFYYTVRYTGNDTYFTEPSPTVGTGTKFYEGEIQSMQYVPRLNSIYLNGNVRLDEASLKVMAKSNDVSLISSSGSLAVTNNYGGKDSYPHSFTIMDPLTLQPISRKMYTDELLGFYSLNFYPVVSETGVCIYLGIKMVDNSFKLPNMLTIVRMNPYSLISADSTFKSPGSSPTSISKLTDEGEYLFYAGYMMNLKDGKLTKLYMVSSGIFSASGKEYLQINQNTVYVYRCRDNALLRSFPVVKGANEIKIDPVTGYVGLHNLSDFLIYDIADGKLLKTIKISGSWQYFLINSTLYSYHGYYLKINYN